MIRDYYQSVCRPLLARAMDVQQLQILPGIFSRWIATGRLSCLKKCENASKKAFEHPPIRGGGCENVWVGTWAAETKTLHGILIVNEVTEEC